MKRDTKRIGNVSELKVMAALIEQGFRVYVPYGDCARCDVAIEDAAGRFFRVQIKTGRLRKGVVVFNAYSAHTFRGSASMRRYEGEVDYFGVYCPQVGRCYLMDAAEVRFHGSLRIDPPLNGQSKTIRWARPYEIGAFVDEKVVGHEAFNVVPFPGPAPS